MNDETFNSIKAGLTDKLVKQGSSIYELEEILKKEAGDYLRDGIDTVKGLAGAATSGGGWAMEHLPTFLGLSTLLAGTTLGGAGYAVNRSLVNEDKQIDEHQAQVDRYKKLTARIKSDYQL